MPSARAQETVLGLVADAGGRLHIGRIREDAELKPKRASRVVKRLKDTGLLKSEHTGPGAPTTYRGLYSLTPEGKKRAGKSLSTPVKKNYPDNNLRARAWRLLRIRGRATIKEVMLIATESGDKPSDQANLGRYFRYLHRAGILARNKAAGGGYVWILRKNLGAKSPQLHKNRRTITDPNSGETFSVGKHLSKKDWIPLLERAVKQLGSRAAVAERMGLSRTVVSRVLNGSYPGRVDLVAAKVIAAFGGKDAR